MSLLYGRLYGGGHFFVWRPPWRVTFFPSGVRWFRWRACLAYPGFCSRLPGRAVHLRRLDGAASPTGACPVLSSLVQPRPVLRARSAASPLPVLVGSSASSVRWPCPQSALHMWASPRLPVPLHRANEKGGAPEDAPPARYGWLRSVPTAGAGTEWPRRPGCPAPGRSPRTRPGCGS